jgi:hypothetical protein
MARKAEAKPREGDCHESDGEVFRACSGSQRTLVLDSHLAFDFGESRIMLQTVVTNVEPKQRR